MTGVSSLTRRGIILAYLLVQLIVSGMLLAVGVYVGESSTLNVILGTVLGYWMRESLQIAQIIGNGPTKPHMQQEA